MILAPGVEGSSPILNISIFGLFVVVTLVIVVRVGKRAAAGTSDFYTAGGGFSGPQNGIAISGDYLSAASFLGIAGAIAINGYDGFLYSIGSSSPGWSRCCSSRNCCATPADSRWVTYWPSGCGSVRFAPPRRRPRWRCRSSTCWPRWPEPAAWSRCCST
ncbi:hypothetical protein PA7_08130 [Pseudonocardia asaccharolytica DSM 44247 = NBRC 16224]|uniref:Uncharacterized protein n=1 Tax=Pseudonocardia asaccharolytica DSM 44247 = NBRC 16224 TaxID=1123024 RepID=A0A511CWM9_9PSEU|nr:hypothetical protein PA7_08130 [Pseudonocardia asaccharolytica DSM 44247 = NBRC 16224]